MTSNFGYWLKFLPTKIYAGYISIPAKIFSSIFSIVILDEWLKIFADLMLTFLPIRLVDNVWYEIHRDIFPPR